MKIIPAILPQSYRAIELGVATIAPSTDTVQIDFVDGFFANNRTWWFNGKDTDKVSSILSEDMGLPFWQEMNYEFDLMVRDPLEHIDTFVALGPSKLIFHIESMDEERMIPYFETIPGIVKETISFGIAIGIDTDPALIAPYKEYIQSIQCMGIAKPGFQGQPYNERVIEQIKRIKELYPDKIISVDGGVTLDTAAALASAGATQLVVGSAIFQSIDPHGTIQTLKDICQNIKATASES